VHKRNCLIIVCLCFCHDARGILFLVFLCVRAWLHWWSYTKSLLLRYFMKHLWEFWRIYNFGALGNKHELIRFWGQKIKGQCHTLRPRGQIRTLGAFSHLSPELNGHILVKLYCSYSVPGPHDTGDFFEVMGLRVKVTGNSF